jgi:hypothetical protein
MNTRLNSIIAGAAFVIAGVFGTPAAALAADNHSTTAAADKPVVAVANPAPSAPTEQDLHPQAVSGAQKTFAPSEEQLRNAKAIVEAGKAMNLPPRAWEIAIATSLQESNLINVGNLGAANDHDSRGLFQQRIGTGGWGTEAQIMDPDHATKAFLERLVKLDGWQDMALTKAAQKVQVSAYPDAYAKHETQAGDIINALYGTGPYADAAKNIK